MTKRSTPIAAIGFVGILGLGAAWFMLSERTNFDASLAPPSLQSDAAPPDSAVAPTVAEREVAPVVTAPRETVRGLAIDAASGAPLAQARLAISSAIPSFVAMDPIAGEAQPGSSDTFLACAEATSAQDGTFEIRGERVVGYVASADPYLCVESPVFVDARQLENGANIALSVAGILAGRVVLREGAAVENAKVKLGSPGAIDVAFHRVPIRESAEVETDAEGRFEFRSVPAGVPLLLTIDAAGHPTQRQAIEAKARQRIEVPCRLDDGSQLLGRVRLENGQGVNGAHVSAREISLRVDPKSPQVPDTAAVEGVTDAAGHFTLRGLALGRYIVTASHDEYARAVVEDVTVPAGGMTLPVDLVLKVGKRVLGVVVDSKGDPIPQANIGLRKSSAFAQNGLGLTPEAAEVLGGWKTQADENGQFASPPLPDGTFDVVAGKSGYVQAIATKVAPGKDPIRLTLKSRGAIEGVVVAEVDSAPVVQFQVAALRPFEMQNLFDPTYFEPVRHSTVVNAQGRFRLNDVAPGKYMLTVTATGFARGEIAGVVVKDGEATSEIRVTLKPEARIRGVVVDKANGAPLPHVRITTRQGMAGMMPDPLTLGVETRTDGKGVFELAGLAPGKYTLSASKQGYAPGFAEPVALVAGDLREDVRILLTRGATLSGHVTRKDSNPVVGAMISANQLGSFTPAIDTSDDAGTYRLEGLAAGTYSVTLLPDLKMGSEDMATSMFRDMQTRSVKLKDGEDATLDFTLENTSGITLDGIVRQNGEPLASVMMSFVPNATDATKGAADPKLRIATTDSKGHYSIDGLSPGAYSVSAQTINDFSNSLRQNFDIELTADLVQQRDFDVSSTGIAGTVRRASDRTPIAGVRVTIDAVTESIAVDAFSKRGGGRRAAEAVTAQDGSYRVSGMAPGDYTVVAGGSMPLGFGNSNYAASAPRRATLRDGAIETGVDLELSPGAVVTGTVTAGGEPAGSASLFFWRDGDPGSTRDAFSTTLTDHSGAFRVQGLDAGQYLVIAKAQGFAPGWKARVEARADQETEVSIALVRGADLAITVLDKEGQDVTRSVTFGLTSADGVNLGRLVTLDELLDFSGSASAAHSFGPIAPGSYTVTVRRGEAETTTTLVHGATPQVAKIELP